VNEHNQPAHDITRGGNQLGKARLQWMDASGIGGISTCPTGETTLFYTDGRVVSGMAADLLPAHLRPNN
jgi:hypothetical protein